MEEVMKIKREPVIWSTYTVMIIAVILLSFFMQGCSTINKNIVRGVNAYCNEPYADRQLVRSLVNASLVESGHSIAVTCEGDPQ